MFRDRTLVPMLPAHDLERAREFYVDKLGLKPMHTETNDLRFEAGDSMFIVYPSDFAGSNKATAAAWEVDDLEATVNQLKADGVDFQEFSMEGMTMENSILTAPDGYRAAWFFDSEGNIIGLGQSA